MPLLFTKFSSDLLEDKELCKRYIEHLVQLGAPRTMEMRQKNQHAFVQCDSEAIVELALINALCEPVFASEDYVSKELSLISNSMQKEYDTKTKCFFDNQSLADRPFLLVGEEIVSERFTFLEKRFKRYAEGTCAFVRKTNFAEYCFIVPGHFFMHSKLRDASCKCLIRIEEPELPKSRQTRQTSVKDIGKLMGEGLLGGLMGNIAASIFGAIFPTDMTTFFDMVYKKIEELVQKELTQVIIDQINGRILGTETWVTNTYIPMRDSTNYSGDFLTKRLLDEENDLATEVIGPLRTDPFAQPGICVFMIGAGMHLAILQELAYIDEKVEAAADSAFVESIKKWAKDYADFAKATTNSILDQRLDLIISKHDDFHDADGTVYYEYWMYDSYDQTSGEHYMWYMDVKGDLHGDLDYSEHVQSDIEARKKSVRADLLESMGDPIAIADDWLKLVDKPLPE